MKRELFIPGNVPSLKNSKIKTSHGIFPSKTVCRYLKEIGIQRYSVKDKVIKGYNKRPNKFGDIVSTWKFPSNAYPVKIGFHFIRSTRHKFDFHNAVQIIADLLVSSGTIKDDDMNFFLPFPYKKDGKWYGYNKQNPGVFVKYIK